MPTTYPEIKKSASVKLNSENSIIALNPTQPLSPHPIAMTITEMFEQSVKPPLTSISEEEQESNASVIIGSMQSNEQNININDINEQESKHSKTITTPERLVVQDITNVLDGLDNEPSINLSNPQEEQELIKPCIELDITHSVKDQSLFDSVQEHEEIKTGQQSKEIFLQPELQQGQLYSDIIEDEIKMKPNVNNSQFGKTDVKLSNKNQPSLINVIEESQIMLNDSMTIKPENLQFSRQNMIFKKEKLADQIITANELESLNETLTVDGTTRSSLKEQNTVSIHETKSPQEQIEQENSSQEGSTHLDEAGVSIDHHLETVFYTDNTNDIKNDITFSNSKAETNSSVVMDSPECISDEIACCDIAANNRIIKNEPDLPVTNEDNEQNLDSSNITRIFEKKINHKTRVLEQQENQEIIKIMDGTEAFQVAATDDSNCLQDESQGMFDANMDTELIEKSTAVFTGDSTEKYYVHGPSSAGNNFNYAFFNTIDDIEDTTEPSSPEDTSTEAIAGSIDRVSSPEEQDLKRDNAIPNELMEANSLQNTVTGYKSNSIYEIDNMLLNLGSEASSVQSTPIAVVTQQMRQYCEELKGILDARKTPDLSKHESDPKLEISENVDALEFFQEELCTLNEELEECELKKSSMFLRKDNLEKKAEIKSHILCNFDYVEEENIIAEDVGNLATENLEHITVCNVVEVSPSVEEHAVKDAVIIEYTASTEACATLINQNKNFSNVENILENATNKPEVSNDDELPPPPLEILEQFEEKQLSNTLSIDTQHALLTKSTSEDCISLYNSTTNQASITNESSELQKLGVIEKELTSLETDLSELSQILEPHSSPILVNDANDTNNEIDTSVDEHLIPGSIAERDILKWRNASPIPNNPYSPDILQKRLSESNRKFNLVDFDRLTNKDNDVPLETQPICEDDKAQVQNQSLQSELGGNQLHNQRYGRDYYINDAKYASGSRKLDTDSQTQVSHSTDDEKSLLLSQKQPSSLQNTSPVVSPSHRSNANLQTGVFPFIKSSSCGNVIPSNKTEDIFSAGRPVQVDPTDPILKKGTKLEYLSTPAHEVYLIPANEPIAAHSLDSLSELSMQSRADESLTLSEDSDITRIYEIGTGETKLILGDAIQNVKVPTTTPPPTPDEPLSGHVEVDSSDNRDVSESNLKYAVVSEEILEIIPQTSTHSSADPVPQDITPSSPTIDRSNLLKPRYVQVKQLSPDTIKFFSPKKPFTGSTSNLSTSAALSKSSCEIRELPVHTTNQMHSSLHIDFPANRNVPAHEFIIEKEVMDVLPSVKELAKCYSGNNQEINTALKPIIKPTVKLRKDFIRQSSDMLHEDHESRSGMPQVANKNRRMYSSTNTINAAEEIREIRRLNLEAYNRPTFVPMAPGHSITARSLSKQIREELKTNATDDFKVHGGHTSPERPSSPVFAPGHLRNSIQFFENLKDK